MFPTIQMPSIVGTKKLSTYMYIFTRRLHVLRLVCGTTIVFYSFYLINLAMFGLYMYYGFGKSSRSRCSLPQIGFLKDLI